MNVTVGTANLILERNSSQIATLKSVRCQDRQIIRGVVVTGKEELEALTSPIERVELAGEDGKFYIFSNATVVVGSDEIITITGERLTINNS